MGTEDEGGEGMVGEDMIHTEGCPTDSADLHGLAHGVRGFHRGKPQISQCHADEILSFSHGGHGYIT